MAALEVGAMTQTIDDFLFYPENLIDCLKNEERVFNYSLELDVDTLAEQFFCHRIEEKPSVQRILPKLENTAHQHIVVFNNMYIYKHGLSEEVFSRFFREMDYQMNSILSKMNYKIQEKPSTKPVKREKRKRNQLFHDQKKVLMNWLLLHKSHPYPNESEKNALAAATNLTYEQVSNWFINNRRRILRNKLQEPSFEAPHIRNKKKLKAEIQTRMQNEINVD